MERAESKTLTGIVKLYGVISWWGSKPVTGLHTLVSVHLERRPIGFHVPLLIFSSYKIYVT